jgi:RNA polymerase sigma-70 factor (ECF subfamily)
MSDPLTERALRGDRDAWAQLVAQHDRRVVVALLGRGLTLDRARDLAQDTWTRLWARQQAGDLAELKLPGLAITQAVFLARDLARRTALAPGGGAGDDDGVEDMVDPGSSMEARLLGHEQLVRAQEALAGCSPMAQRIFRLHYEHPELLQREIAERVGLSLQRVRQTLCEVRARLRREVER